MKLYFKFLILSLLLISINIACDEQFRQKQSATTTPKATESIIVETDSVPSDIRIEIENIWINQQIDSALSSYLIDSDIELAKTFRPFVKEIILDIMINYDHLQLDPYTWETSTISIWIGNGYDHLKVWRPAEINFLPEEKRFIWSLYQHWLKTDYRIHNNKTLRELLKKS